MLGIKLRNKRMKWIISCITVDIILVSPDFSVTTISQCERRTTRKVLICAKLSSVSPNPNSGSSPLEHAGGVKALGSLMINL